LSRSMQSRFRALRKPVELKMRYSPTLVPVSMGRCHLSLPAEIVFGTGATMQILVCSLSKPKSYSLVKVKNSTRRKRKARRICNVPFS